MGSNFSKKAENAQQTVSNLSNIQKVILFAIVIVVLYFIYVFVFQDNEKKMLLKDHDARQGKVIPAGDIPAITVSNYTISVWLFISEWNYNYGQEKNVLARYYLDDGDSQANRHKPAPSITLDAHTNDLNVNISYHDPQGTNSTAKVHTCKVASLPLQKWVNVIMTVNNRALDVYIDGKLTRTCMIPGVPVSGISSDLYISHSSKSNIPGFAGRMSDITIYSYAINPQQAYDVYRKGSSMTGITSALTRYQLQFALLEDNKIKSSYTI
jgi:heme/copper-type cytochrome/quinol oxidase subunit 2